MFKTSELPKVRLAVRDAQEEFIQEWARMSSSWGINRTMAQIHALLYITGEHMSMDEICQRLQISRGNASMNLRNLLDWGVIRRFRRPGERHDNYLSDMDAVTMVARVIRERKRREIDPTVDVLRTCLQRLPPSDEPEARLLSERVSGLLEVFEVLDLAFRSILATDDQAKAMMSRKDLLKNLLEQIAERPDNQKT